MIEQRHQMKEDEIEVSFEEERPLSFLQKIWCVNYLYNLWLWNLTPGKRAWVRFFRLAVYLFLTLVWIQIFWAILGH